MALRLHSINDWYQVMPKLFVDDGWRIAHETCTAALMHSPCPVGGHFVKFQLKQLKVQEPPEEPSQLLVRPEVRGLTDSTEKLRLCSVLFGDVGEVVNFFQGEGTWLMRRDYPRKGDCAMAFSSETRECLVLTRPESEQGSFTAYVISREACFADWAEAHFGAALCSAHQEAEALLNRKGMQELRELDRRFYVVISMQSFKRGMPLLPAKPGELAVTEIDAGRKVGLPRWVRYESRKFRVAEYLSAFLERLGCEVNVYDSLDGQKCVPYMCVMRREQWEFVRDRFFDAYRLQKTAYRHANGGSGAPNVHDEVVPKFQPMTSDLEERLKLAQGPRLVVRKTFFDVEEQLPRPARRPRTMPLWVLFH